MDLETYTRPSRVKIYRQHRCRRTHPTYRRFARCALPRLASVSGEGAYAVVAWCGPGSAQLYENPDAADIGKRIIDKERCCNVCRNRHEIIQLRK